MLTHVLHFGITDRLHHAIHQAYICLDIPIFCIYEVFGSFIKNNPLLKMQQLVIDLLLPVVLLSYVLLYTFD